MSWDHQQPFTEDGPLWEQIANRLRRAIDSGHFPPGAVLPTEAELNAAFGVSRTTSRAAMNKLVQEGLVVRRAGIGSVVLDMQVERPVSQLAGFSEDMRRRGLSSSYEVLRAGMEAPSPEAAEALGLPAGDKSFVSERLFRANGRLIGLSESWLRPDLFSHHPPPSVADLAAGSLYTWLNRTAGIEIVQGVEHIEAAIASPATCANLEMAPGSPVLVVRRLGRSRTGLAVEFAVTTYRADRYRFRIEH